MPVLVKLPQSLAVDADGQRELSFDLADGARLQDLLAAVQQRYPALGRRLCDDTGQIRRYVNVYVGDEESRSLEGLSTPVPANADVLVAGSVAGG